MDGLNSGGCAFADSPAEAAVARRYPLDPTTTTAPSVAALACHPDYPSHRCSGLPVFGLAQMFSTVSPAMFKEYEVDYASRLCERFGLVYYGCCDPLDGRMAEDTFDEVRVREDFETSRDICDRHGCPLELILKDISTVRYEPQRLWKWAETAMDVVGTTN